MAFIYRYHINDARIRDSINLIQFREDIIKTITEFYKSNLKDCRVLEDYYEYKLHFSVDNKSLRDFGKQLLENAPKLRELRDHTKRNSGAFFVRRIQEYYAFIERKKDKEISNIQLIDVIDFNDLERFTSDARNKLNNYAEQYNVRFTNDENELDVLARAFYMDVFRLEGSELDLKYNLQFVSFNKSIELVRLKGYHRRNTNKNRIISEVDVEQLKSSEIKNNEENNHSLVDGFSLLSHIKRVHKSEVERIMKSLSIHIKPSKLIKNFDGWDYKQINFTVHNVGQALTTSLSVLEQPPFLYFDFGISEGENFFNRPKDMTVDVSGKPSIIISHVHRDHWYGITVFTESFECDWYIPDQQKEVLFEKRCAEIIASGGSVSIISTAISSSLGTVFIGGKSKRKVTRLPKHKHENGLGLKIKLFSDTMTDINILVPGDQRYDYIPKRYLDEIDILVASHHGGEYSWSKHRKVYKEIPSSTNESGKIIYSYGNSNTYEHPSKVADYQKNRWYIEHHTAIDSDFKLK